MDFITRLNKALEEWFLLNHPFYQKWNEGMLSKDDLKIYAKEYYHHVAAFPRYISQIHTLCDDIGARQILLDNLIDEEKGENNHPELWLRFSEGVGNERVANSKPQLDATKNLVDGFFELTKESYATGLGALYAYERQTPFVSCSKIEGLKKHYAVRDGRTLEFFEVHQKTDEWHTEELVKLIGKLSDDEQEKVFDGAVKGAKLLWGFLDGMNEVTVH